MESQRFLFLFIKAAPCFCRCQHCDFAVDAPYQPAAFDQLKLLIQPFVDYHDTGSAPYTAIAAPLADSPLNNPDLAVWNSYLRDHEIEGWYSLAVNGFRLMTADQWPRVLEPLRAAGTEILELTLYGTTDTHDWFAGRPRDFAGIRTLAEVWRSLGGQMMWALFAHKRNLDQIGSLRDWLRDTFDTTCEVDHWGFLGHANQIEDLRLEHTDLDRLDDAARANLGHLKPESAWVQTLADSTDAPFAAQPPVIHMVVESDGTLRLPYTPAAQGHQGIVIGNILADPVDRVMEAWTTAFAEWLSAFPKLGTLSQTYGDPAGTRLYDFASIKRKWCALALN